MEGYFVNHGGISLENRFGWTDRVANDHTTKGEKISPPITWIDADSQ